MNAQQHELAIEAAAIKTRAADLHARLMNAKDADQCAGLARELASLHERHCAIQEQLQRQQRLVA